MRKVMIAAVAFVLFGALVLGADAGRIVWTSNRAGGNRLNLWGIDPDGSNAIQITTDFGAALHPAISPDGKKIAFSSPDTGTWYIYLIDSDGKDLEQFTDFSSAVPDWSSDGTRLVFNSDHDDEPKDTPDVWAMNVDGTGLTEFVDNPPVADFNPQWSPDGKYILFTTDRHKKYDLYLIELATGKLTRLTPLTTNEWNGRWSPDGSKIAFVSDRFGQPDLFVMNINGTGIKRLTTSKARDSEPAWSPDGTQLVFVSDRTGYTDLWIINADGTGLHQLTNDKTMDRFPDWGP